MTLAFGEVLGISADPRDLFVAALEASPDLVYVVDPASGRLLEVNQTTCIALGYSRAELLARRVADLQVPSAARGVEQRLAQLVGIRPRTMRRKSIFRRKDGSEFPVEIHARAAQVADRMVVVSVTRDVSESALIERELRLSQERFLTIFRASPLAMGIGAVEDGCAIDVNDAYLEFFGYHDRDEVIGRTAAELNLWVDPAQRSELLRRLQLGEKVRNVEARFRKKSGDIATALFSMEIVPLQGQPVAVTMRVDITDRVRVEQALRESEERFALFMRHLPGAAFIKDAYGRYLYANPGAESGQRVPPGGSLGRTDEELFGANSAREFKATDRRVFEMG